jgi:hypothetical protein
MGNKFSSGKNAVAMCDRCGQRYKLTELKKEVQKQRMFNLLVCQQCWDPDHPQLMLGTFPVDDPQGVRNPRVDTTYNVAGPMPDGYNSGGSRSIQWGWAPVGGSSGFDAPLTPNYLVGTTSVGTVTVAVS